MSEILDGTKQSLTFDENKQLALFGHLLNDARFYTQAMHRLLPEYFANGYVVKVLQLKKKFYEMFKRAPNVSEIQSLPELQLEEQKVRNRVMEVIRLGDHWSREFGLDALQKELSDWLKAQVYRAAVHRSSQLYNAQKTDDAFTVIEGMVREIREIKFEADPEEHFEDYVGEMAANNQQYGDALTTGLTVFDRLLTPKAQAGALLPGDMSIILAPTNVGKTTSMITTIKHNLWLGKHVLFITHEGRPSDIKEKLWCAMLDCSPQDLCGYKDPHTGLWHAGLHQTAEGRRKMDFALMWMRRFLVYVPMNKPGLTIEDVAAEVRRRQEERMQHNGGKGFDLLVDDYPAKLTTMMARQGVWSKRTIDEHVYNYFAHLGLEYKFHVLCAIQTNREGSRVNKGQREDRLLTMEDVQESWGPMTAATNVWTMNRDVVARSKNRLTYYIDKSRSSETGYAIVCKTNYSHSITHSNDLGATYYRGSSTYGEKLDQLVEQYMGRAIDEQALLGL